MEDNIAGSPSCPELRTILQEWPKYGIKKPLSTIKRIIGTKDGMNKRRISIVTIRLGGGEMGGAGEGAKESSPCFAFCDFGIRFKFFFHVYLLLRETDRA